MKTTEVPQYGVSGIFVLITMCLVKTFTFLDVAVDEDQNTSNAVVKRI